MGFENISREEKDGLDQGTLCPWIPIVTLKKYWDHVKGDIVRVYKEFQGEGFVGWCLKNTFFTLIPKVDGLVNVWDFSPLAFGDLYARSLPRSLLDD